MTAISFRAFFHNYLLEHHTRGARVTHFATFWLIPLCGVLLFYGFQLWLIPATVATIFLINWGSHIFCEGNLPTFLSPSSDGIGFLRYRWWSIRCYFRMVLFLLLGKERF